ncbi:ATP-binding protein [Clostridium sp. D2Q-14]|uniref:ATP-binding protein n=1 Tax=Anaeromonas gelatinilytica TaxID=2683194 RepID=UPI00193C252A|nr:ATP-binding protein [Anaeromonas gelatinilytica]MBS4534459.1 ATP-binding protein [Anaeromonas gelatinilytica]
MSVVRDLFPGGNTSEGFYSYYDYIIEKDANRIFILKGGPGVGKSSLMKNIGKEFIDRGYDLEYHHCSSDDYSIDSITIPKLKVAMIDGTAPHIVDPKNPGAVDEIINLGDFWNKDKMEENKDEIILLSNEVSKSFKRAYKYLKAIRPLIEDIIEMNVEALNFGKINFITNELISEIFKDRIYLNKRGKIRHLFGSAYTPNGNIDYNKSILSVCKKIYRLKGDYGTGKTTILRKIYNDAIERGLDVEVLHTPLIPEKIQSIYIKDIEIGITTSDKLQSVDNILDLKNYMDIDILNKNENKIIEDKQLVDQLMSKSVENLKEAKYIHDELEKFYIKNINFDGINLLKKDLINRILKYDK